MADNLEQELSTRSETKTDIPTNNDKKVIDIEMERRRPLLADDDGDPDKLSSETPDTKMTKFTVYKNLVVYSVSFVLLFSSLMSFSNIQSTINIEDGLGTTGLAVLYSTMVFTSLFVTMVTLPLLSYKIMTLTTMLTYICYVATGFYSSWYTVIPATVIIGIGASHLWPTQQAYITQLGKIHAVNTKASNEDTFSHFFGIFFGLFYTCQVWGNLCSSIVFGTFKADGTNDTNTSIPSSVCGSKFCASEAQSGSVITQPSQREVNIFTAFCVTVSVLAVLLILFLLTNVKAPPQPSKKQSVLSKVAGVCRLLLTSRDQQLLIPITVVGGITMAFITGDYNVAFVSCPYGVGTIGFVMITYGITSSVCSFTIGRLAKKTGSMPLLYVGICAQLAVCLTMLLWTPHENQKYVIFILAALWGVGDATNQPLTMALYSSYFTKDLDSALSSFRVLNSVGWAMSFGYSSWLCTDIKVYILISFLVVSSICLGILHGKQKRSV